MDEQRDKVKQELSEETLRQFITASPTSSWTILPAERIEVLDGGEESSTKPGKNQDQGNEHATERCKPAVVDPLDAQAEDVSDGISIISDCESTGRLTPNPLFGNILNDLSPHFELPPAATLDAHHLLLGGDASPQLRSRRNQPMEAIDHAGSEVKTRTTTGTQQPLAELRNADRGSGLHIVGYRVPQLVQSGLTAVFYVGVTLALLSFIGRLKNPEWRQVLGEEKPLTELEQRLVELELQNNLMRAEIDIMSKQLNYLSSLASSNSGQAQSPSQRKPKTFKAWPGNGNAVDPVDITKQDLKKPYKCPDGKYVEIAGMCMEHVMGKPHAESLADEIGDVVNDVLQQSQAFHHFDKVTEKLGTLASDAQSEHKHAGNQRGERYPSKQHQRQFGDSKEHQRFKDRSKEHQRFNKEHSKEHKRSRSKEYDDSNESKEHRSHDSKERYNRHKHQQQQQHQRSKERDDSDSADWHERIMEQHENARQRQDHKRKNNWYLERGSSREQKRSSEMRH